MKKLTMIVLTVIGMALVSYGGNVNTTFSSNDASTTSIEIAKPHTQQYKDIKKILDEFDQDVKNAKSCEDLENAGLSMLIKLMSIAEQEYDEDMTKEEEDELTEQMNVTEKKIEQLQEQWGCQPEEEEEESEEEGPKAITTEEWDVIINDFETLTNKLEKMTDLDFDDEENLGVMLEFIMEAQPLMDKIENSDPATLTEKQRNRLESINDRFNKAAEKIDLE